MKESYSREASPDFLEKLKEDRLFPLLERVKALGDDTTEEVYSATIRMLKKTVIPAMYNLRPKVEIVIPEKYQDYKGDILSILRQAHQIGYEIARYLKTSSSPHEDIVEILAYCVDQMGMDQEDYRGRVERAMDNISFTAQPLFTRISTN